MSLPLVNIVNMTPYPASGTVSYESAFCSNDNFTVAGNFGSWTATSRGICLVNGITATVNVNGNQVSTLPYSSSGTTYSQFRIVEIASGQFAILSNVDFSCYIQIVNQTFNPMNLVSGSVISGSYDYYLIPPPASIAPGSSANFVIVSTNSLAGTDGGCAYTVTNAQNESENLIISYACPWSANPNYASAIMGSAIMPTPLPGIQIQQIPNPVPQWGHPLFAQFTLIQS